LSNNNNILEFLLNSSLRQDGEENPAEAFAKGGNSDEQL
jgi:hypothetical protein